MWLATQFGFYSIVRKKPDEFHVRGRVRRDLENLVRLTGLDREVLVSQPADYRYRIIVGPEEIALIMRRLAETIDYTNFKSRVAERPDQRAKGHAYHEIWDTMFALQEAPGETAKPYRKAGPWAPTGGR
jgi:hypothetical protein